MTHDDGQTTGRTVVGLFARRRDAEGAIRDLKAAGFKDDQVGVALQDKEEQGDLLESTGAKEAEGAAAGAMSGGLVGGLIGLRGSPRPTRATSTRACAWGAPWSRWTPVRGQRRRWSSSTGTAWTSDPPALS